MTTVEHNHLDMQRRDRGVCPACDVAWARQAPKDDKAKQSKAEKQIEFLVAREGKLGEQRYGHKPGRDE